MSLALLIALLVIAAHANASPNVVVLMADDLSTSALNDALSHGWMPNLQSGIINQGMSFPNYTVTDSVCAPSRATFLTGQHSHNHGVRTNVPPSGGVTKLNDSSTLATWLHAAGYRTGLVGKYLNGYGTDVPATYVPPGWDDWQALTTADQMYGYTLNDNGGLVTYGSQPADYQTDVLSGRALDFLNEAEDNDEQPFFLVVTPQAPHQESGFLCALNVGAVAPLPPAPRHLGVTDGLALPTSLNFNEQNITDKPSWIANFPLLTVPQKQCLRTAHRNRVGSMLAFDDLIGAVLTRLQALGETDTVVIFTSDNGYLLGEHRVHAKQQAFEEAVRVPLYVKGPGISGVAGQLVANVDLSATIVDLAAASPGHVLDGRSFVPILQNPNFTPWRSALLIEHEKSGGKVVPPTYQAVVTSPYKWVEYVNGERELYDLTLDPSELTSQHSNPTYFPVKAMMKSLLDALENCAGVSCWHE